MNPVGVNCFGLNPQLHADFESTARRLREIGFESLEPLLVFPEAMGAPSAAIAERLRLAGQDGAYWVDTVAQERLALLRELGFRIEGAHLGLLNMVPGGLKAVLPYAARFAAEQGLSYLVHSPQKKSIAEMRPDAEAFREELDLLGEQGIELIFHCHYQEFADDGGDTPFAWLLREVPKLRVELDVGWVCYAGADVLRVMEEYRERIAILHFKDIVPGAAAIGPRGIFTAIGEGAIPLREILEKAEALSLSYTGFVIDQDASHTDMLEELARGYANLQ